MTICLPAAASVAPTHLSRPPRVDSAGPEATALAASAGLVLDEWQADVLDVALGERADGQWSAREVGLVVPRQNGKGSILEALIVAALFLFDEQLVLYSAHEFKTAQETFLRVKSLIEGSDDLYSRVLKFHNAHGAEGVELRNGNRLRIVARTKGSGRGFTPSRIVLDEALALSTRSVSALQFSLSAQPNPQMWYASSHPEDDAPEGDVLRSIMRRGRDGDDALAYVEFCAPDDADPADRDAWAVANPGYPHRIGPDAIESERRGPSTAADFARERLGIVDLTVVTTEQIIPAGPWASQADPDAESGSTREYSIDASPDLKSAAITVSDGTTGVVLEHHPGTSWLAPKLVELGITHVWLDPRGPASALLVDLEEHGITWTEITAAQHAQACGGLLGAVLDGTFTHLDQAALNDAVAGAIRRPYGDAWAWSRIKSSVDICPLVGVTIARWAALQQEGDSAPVFAY